MPAFTNAVAAALAGSSLTAALLVHFDFATAPIRVWTGIGTLNAAGFDWLGMGQLGAISDLQSAFGGTAPTVTFTLSGVDPTILAAALAAETEVKGRPVTVFLQVFDDAMRPLDQPHAVYAGILDVMRGSLSPTLCTVEVTAETPFARRHVPPFGYLSDRDQQALFPGDDGLDQVTAMASRDTQWPIY